MSCIEANRENRAPCITASICFFTTAPCSNNQSIFFISNNMGSGRNCPDCEGMCSIVNTQSQSRSSVGDSGISLHGDKRQALLTVSIPSTHPRGNWPFGFYIWRGLGPFEWSGRISENDSSNCSFLSFAYGHPLKLNCFPQPSRSLWFIP
jgi:hypothetical protein